MKSKVIAAGVLCILASTIAFPQGKTRVDVRQELIELEAVGFNPAEDNIEYPNNLMIAEQKLAALKIRNKEKAYKMPVSVLNP